MKKSYILVVTSEDFWRADKKNNFNTLWINQKYLYAEGILHTRLATFTKICFQRDASPGFTTVSFIWATFILPHQTKFLTLPRLPKLMIFFITQYLIFVDTFLQARIFKATKNPQLGLNYLKCFLVTNLQRRQTVINWTHFCTLSSNIHNIKCLSVLCVSDLLMILKWHLVDVQLFVTC